MTVLDLSPPAFSIPSRRNVFINPTEMYLRTFYELAEEEPTGVEPRRADLMHRLGISRSAVGQQVDKMCSDGLVVPMPGRRVMLTDVGRDAAMAVVRKHRLAERLLVDVVGLEWHLVHAEATRWQHVLGHEVERRLLTLLDDPRTSPFGCPIPGLAKLDPAWEGCRAPRHDLTVARLVDAVREGHRSVVLASVPESVQADPDLLARMSAAGVLPGRELRVVVVDGDVVRVDAGGGGLELGGAVGRVLRVSRDLRPRSGAEWPPTSL